MHSCKMEDEAHCSWSTLATFIVLSFIMGTTPLMMFFSMHYMHSTILLVALKCDVSLVLFTLSTVVALRSSAARITVLKNLQQKSTYWKMLVLGFLQNAAPYFLIAYAVRYIPITLVSVFIVATQWWVFLLERGSCKRHNQRVRTAHKIGMVAGILGVVIMVVSIIVENLHCHPQRKTISNKTNMSHVLQKDEIASPMDGDCLHVKELLIGVTCVALAPLSWAISTVFWKRHQGEIHNTVHNIGRNAFGGLISTVGFIIFGIFYDFGSINWHVRKWIVYIAYLGVVTGWLGTLLAQSLFSKLGPSIKNQALTAMPLIAFVEDCLFIRMRFHSMSKFSHSFAAELVGLLFVTLGSFAFNVPEHVPRTDSMHKADGGTVSERLISQENSDYPCERIRDGHLDELMRNQIYQYKWDEEYEESDNYADEVNMGGHELARLDTEDCVEYLKRAPIASKIP